MDEQNTQQVTGDQLLQDANELVARIQKSRDEFMERTGGLVASMEHGIAELERNMDETDRQMDELNKQTILEIDEAIIEEFSEETPSQ